jgi:hypothetical protein
MCAEPQPLTVREAEGYHAVEVLGDQEIRGLDALLVTILWLILIVFIILVFLNTPGIR